MRAQTEAHQSRSDQLRLVSGYLLTCLSFAVPLLGAMLGVGNHPSLSRSIPEGLGSFLVIGGLAYAVVHRRGSRARSFASLVVGVLMCMVAGGNMQREIEEAEEVRSFVSAAVRFQQEQEAGALEFKNRFEKFDLAAVLTAQTLGTSEGRAEGRARLREFRALLRERHARLMTHASETERFFKANMPTAWRDTALRELAEASAVNQTAFASLDRAQSAMADGMDEMLDWADRHKADVQFSKDRVNFKSAQVQMEFNLLVAKLKSREQEMEKAVSTVNTLQARARELYRRYSIHNEPNIKSP